MAPHNLRMGTQAKKAAGQDWYLKEWLTSLGVRFPQAWLVKNLDYSEGKASNVLTGKKRYDKDLVNEIAKALQIHPHELLMKPQEAFALRQQRAAALEIAAQAPVDDGAIPDRKKAG